MSKLEELIAKYCPNGVEYVSIGSVVNYEQPSKYIVKDTDYNDDFSTPVLTAGQSFILGYTNEKDNLYHASKENPVIIFDDFTGAFKWVEFSFKVKSSAIKMLTANTDKTTLRYIYHIMGNIGYSSDEHKRLWISRYSKIKIPLPPLPVQREIVRILDNFTELTEELTKELTEELTARKKQYEYYRDKLLTFGDEVEWKTLGKVVTIKNGKDYKHFGEGNIPVYGSGGIIAYIDKFAYNRPSVLIPRKGSIDKLYYVETPFWTVDTIFYTDINTEIINPKFVYYYLQTQHLERLNTAGGVPSLTQTVLKSVPIPVPPLEEQERIVAILDRFDTLCNDLTSGLPAEIEARRKQYEYYRDKLLSFPKRSADKKVTA